ncbi:MAG: 1-(5-phosphoribosyl)-5-[(5-phosphoribosylamino)methylideneamino]imidazole-4-carboxamide isomerase [Ruminococcaceae bacterium]|nr:1-(5-phosphoribosyl)-5-[(5-phosphoribosylamino)methylideneamino]imidazole-4-carboxamide isomerase [Oscillospiraceae bacterium]
MLIYPAIDLYEGKAVRLFKGNYDEMTVYGDDPLKIAEDFERNGATHIHMVDLEGAKHGTTPNFESVKRVKNNTALFVEIGGGIRSVETIDKYVDAGIDRVILGTAAVCAEGFVEKAVKEFGEKIAVGIDILDGYVAIKGWTEKSQLRAFDFAEKMEDIGVKTMICTDISKDGAMQGTNHQLYRQLSERFSMQIIASGGVSSIDDVERLAALRIHGAIIGKAYYTGAVNIKEAVEVAK